MTHLISIRDLSRQEVFALFELADSYLAKGRDNSLVLNERMGGLLFFQPSTRTRIGFESAAWKLGYKTILLDESKPSISKGWSESMADTIRTMNAYVDIFFVRHTEAAIFDEILPYTDKPVINCGNGYDEHPTQALIDGYAIWKKFGKLDGLTITLIGDSRYSRAAHSLVLLLSKFAGITLNQITPDELTLPDEYVENLRVNRITKRELGQEDILYSVGLPPINPSGEFSQDTVRQYIVDKKVVESLRKNSVIMNPLPRIDEIDTDVDKSPKAYYFKQNEFGIYMRMAIIDTFMGISENIKKTGTP